jgi:ABC-type transport system involved in cytochrome bd biosynthesis fused ATPase/permease subunit
MTLVQLVAVLGFGIMAMVLAVVMAIGLLKVSEYFE